MLLRNALRTTLITSVLCGLSVAWYHTEHRCTAETQSRECELDQKTPSVIKPRVEPSNDYEAVPHSIDDIIPTESPVQQQNLVFEPRFITPVKSHVYV